jgi:gamma-glutamyltranspeptidase/glutathione hydrolase
MRDFQAPGRSAVYATNAMAATSMPAATLAALEALRAGGNALDAAVTAAALLGVIEPQSTGIGGDCFCLYKPAGKPVVALNGSGRAPSGVSLEALHAAGVTALTASSPHAVTIPGAVSAWETLLAAHGRKGLADALQPAIKAADEGFVIAPRVAFDWAESAPRLQATGATSLLPGGTPPPVGTKFHNPALAATLRAIAAGGAAAFYEGALAAAMVAELRARGGFHTAADFAAGRHAAEFVTPITKNIGGHDIWECPPNGSGIVALQIMAIMDGFSATGYTGPLDPLRVHRHIEAARLAYRDRNAFLADPAQAAVPVDHWLSDSYIAALRAGIDDEHAATALPPAGTAHKDTVYLAVVDSDGNACSFINSIFDNFGSAILAGDTGILLHNRGMGFTMEPGHPNVIAGSKRPMHTIIPAMATQNGEASIVFGVMGAHYQPMGQSFVLANMLDFGLDPQAALDAARYFPNAGAVDVERGISPSLRAALVAKGHRLTDLARPHGGGQAIRIDRANGILVAGSDPRKDGCALGY